MFYHVLWTNRVLMQSTKSALHCRALQAFDEDVMACFEESTLVQCTSNA